MSKAVSIKKNKRSSLVPLMLIAPSIILILIFMVYPIFNVFSLSVQNYNYADFANRGFVGMQNFVKIFTKDTVFLNSIGFSLKWVSVEVLLQLICGLIVALVLNVQFKLRGLARSLTLVPWAVSGVLTTMLWMLIYNQSIGLISQILLKFGVSPGNLPAWVADPKYIFASVVIADLWRGVPFFAITFLAALQSIPNELYESCDVDGATKLQKFFYVTLPFLKETIVLTTLLRAIWTFNAIDMIFTLTGGGPAHMTTTVPIYMMTTAVVDGNYGYGSAIGVISFVFLFLFAAFYLKISRFGVEKNG